MYQRQRHAGGRRRAPKLRAGLTEGSIVYGEIKAAERAVGAAKNKRHTPNHTPTSLSLRLAERGKLCFFPVEEARGVSAGEVVRAKLQKKGEVFYARVLESLGYFDGNASFLSALSLQQLSVKTDFSEEVLLEAARLEGYVYAGEREDVRTLDFVTIDGEQARDFDDAVQAEECEEGGWLVRVAIADVAHYVGVGSRLDEEACLRGNSRYLTDRVVPMLPTRLSEDLCSLRAGEDRPCVMAEMRIDAAGRLLQSRFARVVIRVSARLTYEAVQEMIEGVLDGGEQSLSKAERGDTERAVLRLYGAWRALGRGRRERGALDIVREEYVARLEQRNLEQRGSGGLSCVGVEGRWSSDSHRVIEDMMILANVAVAERLSEAGVSFVARGHEKPSLEKWQGFEKDLSTLGLSSLLAKEGAKGGGGAGSKRGDRKTDDKEDAAEGLRWRLRAVLAGVARRGEGVSFLASEAILRAQSQARYVVFDGVGGGGVGGAEHFALALDYYCHFTSPIRRYADLCVHRSLLGLLGIGDDLGDGVSSVTSSLCEGLVSNERSAVALERVVFQRMVCSCLAAREVIDEEVYEGIVIKVMGFGFFVRLVGWGIEGVVMRGSVAGYRYSRAREEVEIGGVRITFGSRVGVRIRESDAVSGRLELSLE